MILDGKCLECIVTGTYSMLIGSDRPPTPWQEKGAIDALAAMLLKFQRLQEINNMMFLFFQSRMWA